MKRRKEIWNDTKKQCIRAERMVSAAEVDAQERLKMERGMKGICGQSTKIVAIHTKSRAYLDQNA